MNTEKKVVCLGGGIGTVNLIKGLKDYFQDLTVVVSMADEGGSSGRLRKLYDIFPPGDLVSCMAALAPTENPKIAELLTYRFPGNRYGGKNMLGGHKIGNLLIVALRDITGDFNKALTLFQKIFNIPGSFLPASSEQVTISAKTIEGQDVYGEEAIDLGKYEGVRVLDRVFIHPENPKVSDVVLEKIKNADILIAGPGDLYTTILPVLIIPAISKAFLESAAEKIFVVNVANKPFETKGYAVSNFVQAITKHLGSFPFNTIVANNNFAVKIPSKYKYDYVKSNHTELPSGVKLVETDLVAEDFPLYHSPHKLAKVIAQTV